MLTEKSWLFEGDENQVFRALELSDGSYLVTWMNDGVQKEAFYSAFDVLIEIAEEYWVVLEEE